MVQTSYCEPLGLWTNPIDVIYTRTKLLGHKTAIVNVGIVFKVGVEGLPSFVTHLRSLRVSGLILHLYGVAWAKVRVGQTSDGDLNLTVLLKISFKEKRALGMECHLEIARENWEIFFSFLGKDYDQRDHHDDHSQEWTCLFFTSSPPFAHSSPLAVSLNRILHPTLLSVITDRVRVTARVLQTPHWFPCSHSCPYTEQCFSNINSTLSLMSKPCSGFPSL